MSQAKLAIDVPNKLEKPDAKPEKTYLYGLGIGGSLIEYDNHPHEPLSLNHGNDLGREEHFQVAEGYYKKSKNLTLARSILLRSLKLFGTNSRELLLLADVEAQLGLLKDAEVRLEQVLRDNPDDGQVNADLGGLRLNRLNDPVGAWPPLQAAMSHGLISADLMRDFIRVCTLLGRYENAAQCFGQLVTSGQARLQDHSAHIRLLLQAECFGAAAEFLHSVDIPAAPAGNEWLLSELLAIVDVVNSKDATQASQIARQGIALITEAGLDALADARGQQVAALRFFAAGFAGALDWLDAKATEKAGDQTAEIFTALLHLFVDRELAAGLTLAEARQILSSARKRPSVSKSPETLQIVTALLRQDAQNVETDTHAAADLWSSFVRPSINANPKTAGKSRFRLPSSLRRMDRSSANIDPAVLARTVVAAVARAPRHWLDPDAFVRETHQLPETQRLELAEALGAHCESVDGTNLIVLTMAIRILDLPGTDSWACRRAAIQEHLAPALRQARMDAGIHNPSDGPSVDAIKDDRRHLKAKATWLLRTGERERARSFLSAAATHNDVDVALEAINQLGELGFAKDAYDLLGRRQSTKPNFKLLLSRYRLAIHLDKESDVVGELVGFLGKLGPLGKNTRVCILLLLDKMVEARAEAALIADLKPSSTAALPAISVALLEWDYPTADQYLSVALKHIRDELTTGGPALKNLQNIATFFHTTQMQSLEVCGEDLGSLAAMEALVIDLVDQLDELDETSQQQVFAIALKLSTTLLRLSYTMRALSITRTLRRWAAEDLSNIHSIVGAYSHSAYSQDRAVAAELETLLRYACTIAMTRTAGISPIDLFTDTAMRELTVGLKVAAALDDANAVSVLGTRAHLCVERLLNDGAIANARAATLAETMVSLNEGLGPALQYLEACHRHHPSRPDVMNRLVKAYRHCGRLDDANAVLSQAEQYSPFIAARLATTWTRRTSDRLSWYQARRMPPDPSAIESYANSIKTGSMRQATNQVRSILGRRAPPQGPITGIVFLGVHYSGVSPALAALPCAELQKQGVAVVSLAADELKTPPVGDPRIDRFNAILHEAVHVRGHPQHIKETFLDWEVDWDNRKVMCLGMNFWCTIFDRMATRFRGFLIDSSTAGFRRTLNDSIIALDRSLFVCELIYDNLAKPELPIRFAGAGHTFPPASAAKIYCQEKGWRRNMHFIGLGVGYENYFSNLENQFTSTVAVVDTTHHRDTRDAFFAIRDRFEAWYANQDKKDLQALASKWIQMDRAGVGDVYLPQATKVHARIIKHRESRGQVLGVFGKIPYDMGYPYMGGPAHSDMADWVTHTVQAAAQSSALVLVKPHPQEIRHDVAGRIREGFIDLIQCEVPDNVILLEHNWFNSRDMIKLIDVGLLWSGTTSLELGASGIKVVVCDDWALKDYPVDHYAPRDRQHYEDLIRDPLLVPECTQEYQEKCAALLAYTSTEDVMRPYPYIQIGATNAFVGPPLINWPAIERYFNNGDPVVTLLARDFNFELT